MRATILRRFAATAISLGVIALGAVSCSDAPTQSRTSFSEYGQIGERLQDVAPDYIHEEMALDQNLAKPADAGGVRILATVETVWRGQAWLIKVAHVTAGTEAEITWGVDGLGTSKLAFGENTLAADTYVAVVQQLRGRRNVYLFPTGLQFNPDDPALLSLSYTGTNLKKIDDLNSLDVFHIGPQTRGWQPLEGTVDTESECVDVDLEHFSRYGIGSDR